VQIVQSVQQLVSNVANLLCRKESPCLSQSVQIIDYILVVVLLEKHYSAELVFHDSIELNDAWVIQMYQSVLEDEQTTCLDIS
jgi:hypothetical protein